MMILLSLGAGLGVNALRWDGRSVPLVPRYITEGKFERISLARAAKLYRQGKAVFLDARSRLAYLENHVKGAKYLFPAVVPEMKLDPETKTYRQTTKDYFKMMYPYMGSILPKDRLIVVYGRTLSYHLAAHLAWRLFKNGHRMLAIMDARLADWEAAGLPVSRPKRAKRKGGRR